MERMFYFKALKSGGLFLHLLDDEKDNNCKYDTNRERNHDALCQTCNDEGYEGEGGGVGAGTDV